MLFSICSALFYIDIISEMFHTKNSAEILHLIHFSLSGGCIERKGLFYGDTASSG